MPPSVTVTPVRALARQRRESEGSRRTLIEQVLDADIPTDPRHDPVRPAEIDLLIRRVEVVVRQQHRVAEIPIDVNVLSSALPAKYPASATCAGPLRPSTSRLPRFDGRLNGAAPTSGPYAPIGMFGKRRVERRRQRAARERLRHLGVQVGVRTDDRTIGPADFLHRRLEPRAQYDDEFDVGAELARRQRRRGNAELRQHALADVLDQIRKLIVEERRASARAAAPEALLDADVEAAIAFGADRREPARQPGIRTSARACTATTTPARCSAP